MKIKHLGENGKSTMILITGGLGYLGARISEHLLKSGYDIRLSTSRKDVHVPPKLAGADVAEMDLTDAGSLKAACSGVDSIIHLAAMNAQTCAGDPEQALIINGLGTLKLLRAATEQGVNNFIYFSTAHVYGAPLVGHISEASLPRPVHPYSITHRVAEDYVFEYCQREEINGAVLRLSNAVGSPISKDADCWMLVVNDIARQIINDKVISLRSAGNTLRDFVPIDDVCRAISFLLDGSVYNSTCETFNIGGGRALTLRELAELMAERSTVVLGYMPEIRFLEGDMPSKQGSSTLEYSVDKIKHAGCCFQHDLVCEIDQLLINCKRWYVNDDV